MSKSGTVPIFHGPFVFRLASGAIATVYPVFRERRGSLLMRRSIAAGLAILALVLSISNGSPTLVAQDPPQTEDLVPPNKQVESAGLEKSAEKAHAWTPLPSDDQAIWTASSFGGDGDIEFTSESITMTAGDPITGVRCLAKLPKENFEIELEGRRNNNFDFFCALTFPVGEDGQCSFVVGGWAGAVVGLSSVDGLDAARNSTKKLMHFENGQWYKIRTRVDKKSIRCWIDEELVVEQPRAGHKFDIRVEMHESLPLGIAAFMCDSEIRNVRWRELKEE